jgi:hypothetical protein
MRISYREITKYFDIYLSQNKAISGIVNIEVGHTITEGRKFITGHLRYIKTYNNESVFNPYYERLLKLKELIQNNEMDNLERKGKIIILLELFANHKKNLTVVDEYSDARYNFLVAEGKLNLSIEQKKHIYELALDQYIDDMTDEYRSSDTKSVAESIKAIIDRVKEGYLTETQKEMVRKRSRILAMKKYFDSIEKLEF